METLTTQFLMEVAKAGNYANKTLPSLPKAERRPRDPFETKVSPRLCRYIVPSEYLWPTEEVAVERGGN